MHQTTHLITDTFKLQAHTTAQACRIMALNTYYIRQLLCTIFEFVRALKGHLCACEMLLDA